MLVRHNVNVDVDELERARGVLKLAAMREDAADDRACYIGAVCALDTIIKGSPKTYEDYVVIFERLAFDKCTGGDAA